jgi:hypothetical protein
VHARSLAHVRSCALAACSRSAPRTASALCASDQQLRRPGGRVLTDIWRQAARAQPCWAWLHPGAQRGRRAAGANAFGWAADRRQAGGGQQHAFGALVERPLPQLTVVVACGRASSRRSEQKTRQRRTVLTDDGCCLLGASLPA